MWEILEACALVLGVRVPQPQAARLLPCGLREESKYRREADQCRLQLTVAKSRAAGLRTPTTKLNARKVIDTHSAQCCAIFPLRASAPQVPTQAQGVCLAPRRVG